MQKIQRGKDRLWYCLAILTLAATMAGCGIETPQAPSWDVNLIIPVVNRSYTALELVERMSSEYVSVDSSGDLSFSLQEELDTLYTDTVLRFADVNSYVLRQLGSYEITPPAPQTESISLVDHIPLAAGEAPDTGITVARPLASLSTISQAEIATGQLTLTANNNTNLDFDSLACTLKDNLDATILTETFPVGVAAGSIAQRQVPLAGHTLYSDLNLVVYFHTPGGFTGALAGQELSVEVDFGDAITVNYATAVVEPSTTDYTQTTLLDTDHDIHEAELAEGTLYYTVTNQLPVPAQLEVTFPEVSNGSGQLQLTVDLPAFGQNTETINLAGWSFVPNGNSLLAEIEASVNGSDGALVTMNATSGFALDLALTDLQLQSAQAVIAPTEVVWQPQEYAVDIPTGLDNATLATADLALTIENRSELSGELELTITADNGHSVNLSGAIAAGSRTNPVSSVISTSDVAELLSPLPRSFTVTGIATVGDGYTLIDISRDDNLSATAKISAPLRFVLAANNVETDIEPVDIDSDIRDEVDRLHTGKFIGTLTSHLPLAAEVMLYLSTDSTSLYDNPLLEIGPLSLAAGSVDGNGNVVETASSENEVALADDDFQIFSNPRIYVGALVSLPGTEGDTVRVRSEDYLDVSGYVRVGARVGGEDF